MRGAIAILLLALAAGIAPCAASEAQDGALRLESRLEGREVPDVSLTLAGGSRTSASALANGRPLLVAFFYRRCAGICTPFLEWLRDAADQVGGLGTDYRVLALSFDETDTAPALRAQAEALELDRNPAWSFGVMSAEELARVAGALGFRFRLDEQSGQYDHDALVVAVDRGRVVGALYGTADSARRLRTLLWTLRGRFVASYPVARDAPLACLSFDPRTGALRPDWGMLLLAAPGVGAIAFALAIFGGVRRSARREASPRPPGSELAC